MTLGRIHSFESFGSVDGPGVRFVVFMQGCRMRCRYCHNPDSWEINAGTEMTAQEVFSKAMRYKEYWGKKGGITVSGGEPLLQIDFVIELFELAKAEGIHTTIDTAAGPYDENDPAFMEKWHRLMALTDLVLLDLKHIDNTAHKKLTGVANTAALAMAKKLSDSNKSVWIRHVLVPEWTDEDKSLTALSDFIKTLHNVERVEVLPFHNLAHYKWEKLGIKYSLAETLPPTEERIINAKSILGCS